MLAIEANHSSNSSSISLQIWPNFNTEVPPVLLPSRRNQGESRRHSNELKIGRILLTPSKKIETQQLHRKSTSTRKLKYLGEKQYPKPGLYQRSSETVLLGEHTGMRGRKQKRFRHEFQDLNKDEFLNFFNKKHSDHSKTFRKGQKELRKKIILGLNLKQCSKDSNMQLPEKEKRRKLMLTNKESNESQNKVAKIYQSLKCCKKEGKENNRDSRNKGCWDMDEETPWSMHDSLPFESIKIIPPSGSDVFKSPSSLLSISIRQSASLLQVPSTLRKRKPEPASFHQNFPESNSFLSFQNQDSNRFFEVNSPSFVLDEVQPEMKVTNPSFSQQKSCTIVSQYLQRVFTELENSLMVKQQQKSELATYIQNSTELDQSLILVSTDLPFKKGQLAPIKEVPFENRGEIQTDILKDSSISKSTNNASSTFAFSKIKTKVQQSQLPPVTQSEQEQSEVIMDAYYEQNQYSEDDVMNSVPCINNLQSRVGIKPDLEGFHSGKKIRIGEMQIEMSELGCSMEGYY